MQIVHRQEIPNKIQDEPLLEYNSLMDEKPEHLRNMGGAGDTQHTEALKFHMFPGELYSLLPSQHQSHANFLEVVAVPKNTLIVK